MNSYYIMIHDIQLGKGEAQQGSSSAQPQFGGDTVYTVMLSSEVCDNSIRRHCNITLTVYKLQK